MRARPGRRSVVAVLTALGLAYALTGCRSVFEAAIGQQASVVESGDALLLVMSDGLLFDAVGVREVLETRPDLHSRLAESLGRAGDERAVPILAELLEDNRVDVRRAAAQALGLIRSRAAAPALAVAVADEDQETGRLAVESLARIGEPFENWAGQLGTLPAEERHDRLFPALFRLSPEVIDGFLDLEAFGASAEHRRWIVYAAGRSGGVRTLPLLRANLGDDDAWVRGWAARGLGRLGEAEDLDRLRPLLGDADSTPVVQALRAGSSLIADGRAAPPQDWRPALGALLSDGRAGVRLSALGAVGRWLPDKELESALEQRFSDASVGERELVLRSMVQGRAERAEELVLRSSLSPEPVLRAAAAQAAVSLAVPEVVELLAADSSPRVRLAALAAVLESDRPDRADVARRALRDRDWAVRAAALEWLAEHPEATIEEILWAMRGPSSSRVPTLAVDGVRALEARHGFDLERGAVIAALERSARDPEYLVRRAAADALERLGRPRPAIGWVVSGVDLGVYRGIAQRFGGDRFVEMETERGRITLQLECEEAPMTCSSFLQLVNQRFYDGLTFHRVVPDFVVQGGDPRGDGWGGPGYTLRDEITRIEFGRGVLGMARSDRHTAGSQFFMTLSEQPHLDGEYTAFGRVVAGEEVLDQIIQGDSIVGMRELSRSMSSARHGGRRAAVDSAP